ncbi:unnamed protein product [Agarophyton chilense]
MAASSDASDTVTINGTAFSKLADGDYDAVVLGTGLTECILSGILSVAGLRVLHCDRNDYYGAACASLNLAQMYAKFLPELPAPEHLITKSRDYNIDLVPKFIMAGGNMVRMLIHTGVTRYLEFRLTQGSFVFSGDRPHKVPATPKEAMTSSIMGLFEKNRCRMFFSFVHSYDPADVSTHDDLDLKTITMAELYKYYGLQPDTISFIGHALALYRDESYLNQPAEPTILKVQLYATSLARHGSSPYLYPLYGLGELPQAFARLSAVHGGTYMLQTPVNQILYNDQGAAVGVRSGDRAAKCRFVAGDPSYFPDSVNKTGRVVRKYCLMDSPPPNTRESSSCQIIIPASQISPPRKSDIYVLVLSFNHRTTPEGMYLGLVSTTVETDSPEEELRPGVELLDNVIESFVSVDDVYEPKESGKRDQCFITKSYDATTHFETTVDDVFDVYRRIFGTDLVLTSGPEGGSVQ